MYNYFQIDIQDNFNQRNKTEILDFGPTPSSQSYFK